ncbi:MAG TPA: PaaX family transcriptional regulator C-terminal domain-containing protein [Kribbellaceae bacterium]|nr:PaaX family transcriptional regulator C-terminal domain-containing protein [Kribbellaceae bacterium]
MVLRPVAARSVLLSVLLGAHPPSLPARDLVAFGEYLGIAETTVRAALSRMVAAGDLLKDGTVYTLSERLVARQRRQDEAVSPSTRAWRGGWELAAVTGTGRSAADRADLRATLTSLRLAELREGLWLRPDNLRRAWPAGLDAVCRRFSGRPDGVPAELAASLWDLDGWARQGEELLGLMDDEDPPKRFAAAAAVVRHLLGDPVLPEPLLPANWPAAALRSSYESYREHLLALRTAF